MSGIHIPKTTLCRLFSNVWVSEKIDQTNIVFLKDFFPEESGISNMQKFTVLGMSLCHGSQSIQQVHKLIILFLEENLELSLLENPPSVRN